MSNGGIDRRKAVSQSPVNIPCLVVEARMLWVVVSARRVGRLDFSR